MGSADGFRARLPPVARARHDRRRRRDHRRTRWSRFTGRIEASQSSWCSTCCGSRSGCAASNRCARPRTACCWWSLVQFVTGLSNIVLQWPLPIAVAHNGGAAILLLLLVMLNFRISSSRPGRAVLPRARRRSSVNPNPHGKHDNHPPPVTASRSTRADETARDATRGVLRGHRHVPFDARHGAVDRADRRHRRHLAAGRRGVRDQLSGRAEDRRDDAAHVVASVGARRNYAPRRSCCSRRCSAAPACATLYTFTNPLTMWLTVATFVGYAVVYTLLLKPYTPQNIVIGGASGAMPPALGWAAVTGARARRRVDSRADHLRLDAAAFLGARAVSPQGLRKRRPADAAEHARRAIHAAAYFPVHGDPVRRHDDAVHLRHERCGVSGVGGAARRDVPRATRGRSIASTPTCSRARPSVIRSCICRCCSPRCSIDHYVRA